MFLGARRKQEAATTTAATTATTANLGPAAGGGDSSAEAATRLATPVLISYRTSSDEQGETSPSLIIPVEHTPLPNGDSPDGEEWVSSPTRPLGDLFLALRRLVEKDPPAVSALLVELATHPSLASNTIDEEVFLRACDGMASRQSERHTPSRGTEEVLEVRQGFATDGMMKLALPEGAAGGKESMDGPTKTKSGGLPKILAQMTDQDTPWFPTDTHGSWAARLFLLLEDPEVSKGGKIVTMIMIFVVMLSTAAVVLESMPELNERPPGCDLNHLTVKACEPEPLEWFNTVEVVCVVFFTMDYLMRIFTVHAHEGVMGIRKKIQCTVAYMRRPLCVIDLIAILPFYLEFLVEDSDALSVFRLARTIRMFKLAKAQPGLGVFVEVVQRSGEPLAILIFFNGIIVILFGSLMYYAEGKRFSVAPEFTSASEEGGVAPYPTGVYVRLNQALKEDEVSPFRSIPFAMWWACTTMTTVGYGDLFPTTIWGKIVAVICFYVGIVFLALPISVLGANFEDIYRAKLAAKQTPEQVALRGSQLRLSIQVPTQQVSAGVLAKLSGLKFLPVGYPNWRAKVFATLEDAGSSLIARWYSVFMMCFIAASTLAFICESMPEFNETPAACGPDNLTVEACEPEPWVGFDTFETICISLFTVDYVLRILFVHASTAAACGVSTSGGEMAGAKQTWFYMVQWLNIMDLLAILPFYIELAIPGGTSGGMAVLRVTRLVRIFKVLKAPKLRSCVGMFINVLRDSLSALVMCWIMTLLTSVFFASFVHFAEGSKYKINEDFPEGAYVRPTTDGYGEEETPYRCIVYSLWWFYVTSTTVGYGDDYPTTTFGRFIGIATFYVGIVLIALPITIVGNSFNVHYPGWVEEYKAEGTAPRQRDDSPALALGDD
mmetsp:Transcript_7161/g.16280  ORF Transcript_7161/g.16280 Transcript_7161/m.16280 type:complete len:890 (-) Transcript_7161:285-2954(-)